MHMDMHNCTTDKHSVQTPVAPPVCNRRRCDSEAPVDSLRPGKGTWTFLDPFFLILFLSTSSDVVHSHMLGRVVTLESTLTLC